MKSNQNYQNISNELDDIFRRNLRMLLSACGWTQMSFSEDMPRKTISLGRSSVNKILNGKQRVSAAFLLGCCDYFKIPVHEMVSLEFNPEKYINAENVKYTNYVDINKLNERHEEVLVKEKQEEPNPELMLAHGKNLITNPEHALFQGYLQEYYCYYCPTNSKENKDKNKILKGILKLQKAGKWCQATLTINTGKVNKEGEINYKTYMEYAAITAYGTALSCNMYSDELDEFCFLMFRLFKINFGAQDFRIAEVLSTSSASETRRPTTHRMLLSREELRNEDLQAILPALELNYSTIAVVKENMKLLCERSEVYREIVNKIMSEFQENEIYFLTESDVRNIAKKCLKSSAEVNEFIMQLRKMAYSYRYNKIGNKADEMPRDILLARGYYKTEDKGKSGMV